MRDRESQRDGAAQSIFSGSPSRAKSASILGLGAVAVALLNLGIAQTLAHQFGVSRQLDAYFVALAVPVALAEILVASMSKVLLPSFVKGRTHKGERMVWEELSTPINFMVILLIIIVVVGLLLARPIVGLIAPGFDVDQRDLASSLLRILLPSVVLAAILSLSLSISHAYNQFGLPTLASVFRRGVQLSLLLVMVPLWGIHGAAVALLLGLVVGALYLLIRTPGRLNYRPIVKFDSPSQPVLFRSWGILLGAGILFKLLPILERTLASLLGEGSISHLAYAASFLPLFTTIISASIATTYFPDFAKSIAHRDSAGLGQDIGRSIRMSAFITIPAVFGIMVLSRPIVTLLFERGQFTAADTKVVAGLLIFACGRFFAPMIADTTSKALYSMDKVSFVFILSVIQASLFVLAVLVLIRWLGIYGIALAGSIMATFSWIAQLVYLKRDIPKLQLKPITRSLALITLSAGVMASVVWVAYNHIDAFGISDTLPGLAVSLLIAIILGILVYGFVVTLLRLEESAQFRSLLLTHLNR